MSQIEKLSATGVVTRSVEKHVEDTLPRYQMRCGFLIARSGRMAKLVCPAESVIPRLSVKKAILVVFCGIECATAAKLFSRIERVRFADIRR